MKPIFLASLSVTSAFSASPVKVAEFIYPAESRPTPQCHASTLAMTSDGLVAAWFGGTREKAPDVGIWVARRGADGWSTPVEVATADGVPCWNPVLFQPKSGPLLLFYKSGAEISSWQSNLMTSTDGGVTWSRSRQLPNGLCGPVKNKPVELTDGTLLCPTSEEPSRDQWLVHFSGTKDLGQTWETSPALNAAGEFHAIQPTILRLGGDRLLALCRTREGRIAKVVSKDSGKTWSAMSFTNLPNPDSGIDAVTLNDGRHLLVYNPVPKGRTPLVVALSTDGLDWKRVLDLETEPGEYSYPSIIQAGDGTVHISYTWKRERVKHVALDPTLLQPLPN